MAYPVTAYKTWSSGNALMAADLNATITKINDEVGMPENIDDFSANSTEYRYYTTPSTGSLPTTASEEFRHLRGAIKRAEVGSSWDVPKYASVGDSDGDYATIALAVAAGKTHIRLCSNVTVTAEQDFTLSNGIILGHGFKLIGSSAITGSILQISGNENIVKDLIVEGQHTSGTTTNGFEVTGNKNRINCFVFQNGAGGTITNAVNDSGSNNVKEIIVEDKAGTITNTIV